MSLGTTGSRLPEPRVRSTRNMLGRTAAPSAAETTPTKTAGRSGTSENVRAIYVNMVDVTTVLGKVIVLGPPVLGHEQRAKPK